MYYTTAYREPMEIARNVMARATHRKAVAGSTSEGDGDEKHIHSYVLP